MSSGVGNPQAAEGVADDGIVFGRHDITGKPDAEAAVPIHMQSTLFAAEVRATPGYEGGNSFSSGKPMQNGYMESLNGKLRDECLLL